MIDYTVIFTRGLSKFAVLVRNNSCEEAIAEAVIIALRSGKPFTSVHAVSILKP